MIDQGDLSEFDLHFVKSGIFTKEMGSILHELFEARLVEDYRLERKYNLDQAREFMDRGELFVDRVEQYFRDQKLLP